MPQKNIVLVGMMGSGKSLTSKRLGDILSRAVISTDQVIEQNEGCSIADIFNELGESRFRDLEYEVVQELAEKEDVIIDCGGGIVLNSKNIDALKKNGILIYLDADPAFIYEQIKDQKHRPLLKVKDPVAKLQELLDQRRPHYKKADIILDANKSISEIADEIVEILKDRGLL